MHSEFVLVATLDGEPLEFLARDVPTGVFFFGFQDTFPGAECFARLTMVEQEANRLGFQAWADGLLCRAMVEPRLSLEVIQRIGDARDELVRGYLWAIGYDVPSRLEQERLAPPRRVAAGPRDGDLSDDDALLLAVPGPNIRLAIRDVAAKARTAPFEVWARWTISEFIWTWRVALQDEMKKRAARAEASASGPSLMDRIGREPA